MKKNLTELCKICKYRYNILTGDKVIKKSEINLVSPTKSKRAMIDFLISMERTHKKLKRVAYNQFKTYQIVNAMKTYFTVKIKKEYLIDFIITVRPNTYTLTGLKELDYYDLKFIVKNYLKES